MREQKNTWLLNAAGTLLAALCGVSGLHAASTNIDVESLQRIPYKGDKGVQVVFVRYADQNWTEVDPSTVLATRDSNYKEVCFEGKFESFLGPLGLKLTGVDGTINFEDKGKRKLAPDLHPLDNIWICGTLQASKTGRGQDLLIYEMAKLPPDSQRYESKFLTLEATRNVAGLIELGNRINQNLGNSRSMGGMIGFERMSGLRERAWKSAIEIKEKDMRADDPNACYEIALLYRDLLKRNNNYRQWVLKTLELNPDHANAGKDAEQFFGMVRVGDKWITKQEHKERNDALLRDTAAAVQLDKDKIRLRNERLEKEISERTVTLLDFQAALRTNDPAARVGALTSLGDKVKDCLDQNFGLAAVDILANINDDAAILPGLDRAAKSENRDIRQLVYTSLAWRASLNDSASQSAYDVLAGALKSEKEKEPAAAAARALSELGGKNAIAALIAGLDSNETAVSDALIEGLKKATQQSMQQKQEWIAWWSANKESIPAKGPEHAGAK